jgi:hypothetical protein
MKILEKKLSQVFWKKTLKLSDRRLRMLIIKQGIIKDVIAKGQGVLKGIVSVFKVILNAQKFVSAQGVITRIQDFLVRRRK